MFPRFPARATFVMDTNFVSGTQKMFLILFRNILCPQQMFPSLRNPRNIMSNNVSSFASTLICIRLHYRGLQSLFLTKRKELWLCASGRFRMRSGMREELWLCANGNILECAVIWRKELCLCANGRMRSGPCACLS